MNLSNYWNLDYRFLPVAFAIYQHIVLIEFSRIHFGKNKTTYYFEGEIFGSYHRNASKATLRPASFHFPVSILSSSRAASLFYSGNRGSLLSSMKTSVLPILAYAVGFSIAANAATAGSRDGWDLFEFTSLVAFGDSYTDDSRLAYFFSHDGQAPPVGWVDPVVSFSFFNQQPCRFG